MIAMISLGIDGIDSALVPDSLAKRHIYRLLNNSSVVYVMHKNQLYACRFNRDNTYTRTLITDECPQIRFMLSKLGG